jgi:hypothetical protein
MAVQGVCCELVSAISLFSRKSTGKNAASPLMSSCVAVCPAAPWAAYRCRARGSVSKKTGKHWVTNREYRLGDTGRQTYENLLALHRAANAARRPTASEATRDLP